MSEYPAAIRKYADQLRGRSMVVMRADMFPVECVVRGYISGSAWKEYKAIGTSLRHRAAQGTEGIRPVAGADLHSRDEGDHRSRREYSFDEMARMVGAEVSEQLRDLTLKVYKKAADYARTKGIIIADTKFEFGRTVPGHHAGGRSADAGFFALLAGGQVHSRAGAGFVRQAVRAGLSGRDPLEQATAGAGASAEVARRTSEKYLEAYQQLTGRELDV